MPGQQARRAGAVAQAIVQARREEARAAVPAAPRAAMVAVDQKADTVPAARPPVAARPVEVRPVEVRRAGTVPMLEEAAAAVAVAVPTEVPIPEPPRAVVDQCMCRPTLATVTTMTS